MKVFRDANGRDWSIAVTIETVRRVRSVCDVDLLDAVNGKLFERLIEDPVLFCDVLYVICAPEAERNGITSEQFGAAMAGDAIDSATNAFLGALVDFFPAAKRQLLEKALRKLDQVQEMAVQRGLELLDSPELDQEIQSILNRSGVGSGSSPESLGSTPSP